MRKASIIAMAALALLTAQCKKNEPKPEEKVMVPITGSVDFGGSKTAITTSGMITPKNGDVIYIYNNGNNVGSMTCTAQTGQQFTCSGEIVGSCLGKTCTFMYLGTGSTEANGTTGISETSSTISFADQTGVSVSDGKISGLDKFHVGSCIAEVSNEGTVTLPMVSKMAIAYFQLKDQNGNAIKGKDVTISGRGVSATATIDKINGTISGNGTGSITVHTDDEGCFYMALIPQSDEVIFTFSGPVDGETNFLYGIRECCFYSEHGSGRPLQVTVTKAHEYVDLGLPSGLLWATCNVGADSPEGYGWYFMWGSVTEGGDLDCSWANCPGNEGSEDYNETAFNTWKAANLTGGVLNPDVDAASVNWGGDWRMPTGGVSGGEWQELVSNTYMEWVYDYDGTGVSGYIVYKVKDEADKGFITHEIEENPEDPAWVTYNKEGNVADLTGDYSLSDVHLFLPAAGDRKGTSVDNAGTKGNYWDCTFASEIPNSADVIFFRSDRQDGRFTRVRMVGQPVRPVRSAL